MRRPSGRLEPGAVVQPMLATTPGKGLSGEAGLQSLGAGWVFEPKLDGYRCLLHRTANGWVLHSRSGANVTERFASLVLPEDIGPVIVDGELVALDVDGRISFSALQRVHGRPGDPPVQFLAFDLLYEAEHGDVRAEPWTARRELLERLEKHGLSVVPYSRSSTTMWKSASALGMEGVLAKRASSRYRSGRSSDWLKFKTRRSLSAVVTAWIESKAGHPEPGSLELSLMDDDGNLTPIGKVGSGLSPRTLSALMSRPLPFVVEVEYQEWTGSALRMPVFKGVRDDIEPADCSMDQLTSNG